MQILFSLPNSYLEIIIFDTLNFVFDLQNLDMFILS